MTTAIIPFDTKRSTEGLAMHIRKMLPMSIKALRQLFGGEGAMFDDAIAYLEKTKLAERSYNKHFKGDVLSWRPDNRIKRKSGITWSKELKGRVRR